MKAPAHQSGNIFFYIFIGIVLFAALGYAVSRSSMNADTISDEKARLYASEIINLGAKAKDTVAKLRLRGCDESKLDFSNSVYKRVDGTAIDAANTNAPSTKECNVYDSAGGGLTPVALPKEAYAEGEPTVTSSWQTGQFGVRVYQVSGVGTTAASGVTSANDLVMSSNYISKSVCMKINDLLGVPNPSNAPPNVTIVGANGTYANGSYAATGIWTVTGSSKNEAVCVNGNLANGYLFWQVLISR